MSTLTYSELVDRIVVDAKTSNRALSIAVEALMEIALHRESHEGRIAIEVLQLMRQVVSDES